MAAAGREPAAGSGTLTPRWVLRASVAEARARGDVALGAAALGVADALAAWTGPAVAPALAHAPLLDRAGPGQRTLIAMLLGALALRACAPSVDARAVDPLAALPVTRSAAALARLLGCSLALLAAPLAHHALAALHALTAGPAAAGAGDWLAVLALEVTQLLVLLGAALGASVLLRRAAPLVLGLGALALAAAGPHIAPLLDPLRLPMARPGGVELLVAVLAWTALALGVAALAGRSRATSRLPAWLSDALGDDRLARGNVRLAALVGAALVAATPLVATHRARPIVDEGTAVTVSARTRHYRFTYPAALAAPARALVARADAVHGDVLALLGGPVAERDAPPIELRLDAPGLLAPGGDPCRDVTLEPGALGALAHATCHEVLRRRAGGDRLERLRDSLGVLVEGLCRTAEHRAEGGDPFWSRFTVAVLHSRRPFQPGEHLSLDALERTRGREAAAALGEAWVEALRRTAGDPALATVVDALVRAAPAARDVEASRAVWTKVLAAAGADVARVEEEVLVVIEDTASRDPRSQIDLPRLAVIEEQQETADLKLVAIPDGRVPLDWDVVCRVASAPDGSHDAAGAPVAAIRLGPDEGGCFQFTREGSLLQLGARPRVQLGLRPLFAAPGLGTIWEDWVQLTYSP